MIDPGRNQAPAVPPTGHLYGGSSTAGPAPTAQAPAPVPPSSQQQQPQQQQQQQHQNGQQLPQQQQMNFQAQPGGSGQHGQTVIVQQAPQFYNHPRPKTYENYKAQQSLGLGVTQIICGLICVIFNSAGIAIGAAGSVSGTAIWIGLFFIMTGSFGVGAKNKGPCLIITFMVLSIVCSVFVFGCISMASVGIAVDNNNQYGDYYNGMYFRRSRNENNARIAMNVMVLLASLIEFVVSIWSAAICCHAACCCREYRGAIHAMPVMQYQTVPGQNGQQQQIIYIQTTSTGGQHGTVYPQNSGQQAFIMQHGTPNPLYGQAYPGLPLYGQVFEGGQPQGANPIAPPAYSSPPPDYGNAGIGGSAGLAASNAPPVEEKNGMPPAY